MSVPSSFGVSATSGVLGSWLSQSTSSGGLASIISGTSTSAGGLTALLSKAASGAPNTTQALEAGALTNSQQRVIQAIGDNTTGPLTIPWNSTGTEPTVVAAIRSAGWIKLDKKTFTDGKVSGGEYTLTKLGQAIYNRTGGGSVSGDASTALTSTDTNGTTTSSGTSAATAADANLQSSVSSLTSILSSVGISV